MKFSKLIIIIGVILTVIFTAAVLYVFLKTSNEPSVLVGAWFAFITSEFFMLSKIKRDEIKKKRRDESGEN